MRFHFPNLARPKKAAKRLADVQSISLAVAQRGVAVALGYRDPHDLERHHTDAAPTPLDQELAEAEFHGRLAHLARALGEALGISDGEAQHALSSMRLTGDRTLSFEDQEAVRTMCWRLGSMPWTGPHDPGATFFVKEKGYPLRRAYLRSYGKPVRCFTDRSSNMGCADFEAKMPKIRMKDFLPLRLWLPYGWWVLEDGGEVLHSRDYKPMWKVRLGERLERMPPWRRITGIKEHHWFTDDGLWTKPEIVAKAKERLAQRGIASLPMLADALPLMVRAGEQCSMDDAVEELRLSVGGQVLI